MFNLLSRHLKKVPARTNFPEKIFSIYFGTFIQCIKYQYRQYYVNDKHNVV